jgi:lipid-binding SYLF domain-containing protein
VSLERAVLKQDDDANQHLYGRAIAPKEILFTRKVPVPAAAPPLDAMLEKYSPQGGKPFPSASGG